MTTMTQASIEDIYQLSPLQQGMLFHALSEPDSAAYRNQLGCRLRGAIDPDRFRAAWQALVDGQPVLRTSFHASGLDQPVQVVRREAELPWSFEDWRGHTPEVQQALWERETGEDRLSPFAVDRAPLMRCRLVRTGAEEFRFRWTHHHLLMDGWCLALVLDQVFDHYQQLGRGEAPRAPEDGPGTAPYRRFIEWLQHQNQEQTREYWSRQMAGWERATPLPPKPAPGPTNNPTTGPAAADQATARVANRLTPDQTRQLRSFAARNRITLSTLIQAAWGLLLARSSGEREVVFGITVAGRPAALAGVEQMLGPFINTIPVRMALGPETPVAQWLTSLHTAQGKRSAFEHAPLSSIRQWAGVNGGTALFESNVIVMNYPLEQAAAEAGGTLERGGIEIGEIEIYDRTDVPLTLQVTPGASCEVELIYDQTRFDADIMRRWLARFLFLLEQISSGAAATLSRLSLIPPAERSELDGFNRTDVAFDAERTFLARFEENAARLPDRAALRCAGERRTYGELNARANRLARHLQQRYALEHGDLVAVQMPRSAALAESILAVWKCGAAYVPIDPAYPESRVQAILDSARPRVVLTPAIVASISEAMAESMAEVSATPAGENLTVEIAADDLAYVIFTSGSTGKPKGAMIEHAGMLNHLLAKVEDLHLNAASRVAQNASHCFDISVWQMFAALLAGGETVIYPDEVVLDPERFLEQNDRDGITILELVPSYLRACLPHLEQQPKSLSRLRYLLVTGETVKPALLASWFALRPSIPVVNAYGPTEASDDITHCILRRPPDSESVPLGKPIRNTRIYVRDAEGNLCPVGVQGEICVSGIGVGRGYWNEPEKTKQAFGEDPDRGEAAAVRMYRTGDLGHWSPDGNLMMAGRKDHQVKIRGYRIELGDIEAALTRLEPVADAVVIDRRDEGREPYLCGYVQLKPGHAADSEVVSNSDSEGLLDSLRQQLPAYMVPAFLLILDQLPLTPNGKIDRKALPEPRHSDAPVDESAEAPRSPVEIALAAIWSRALGVARPGLHDDFFRLGGDSILAMQIASEAGRAGWKISPKHIFENPTLAQLARVAEPARVAELARVEKAVSASTEETDAVQPPDLPLAPVALTPIQRHFFAQHLAEPHFYNQSAAFELPRDVDDALLAEALRAATKHHPALTTRFVRVEPGVGRQDSKESQDGVEPQGGHEGGSGVWAQQSVTGPAADAFLPRLEIHTVGAEEDAAFERLVTRQHASLSFTAGPLMRACLYRFASGRPPRLVLVVHHLAIDAVSWPVLIQDIFAAHRSLTDGRAIELPPEPVPYLAYAARLAAEEASGAAEQEIAYWSRLAGEAWPKLPRDEQSPEEIGAGGSGRDSSSDENNIANDIANTGEVQVELTQQETEALLRESSRAYRTGINDLLLAGLALAFRDWTGQHRLLVELEGHGRSHPAVEDDVSRTVGWFTTQFPVAVRAGRDLASTIKATKEELRAIPHQGIHWGSLRYGTAWPGGHPELRGVPQPEVLFNYLGRVEMGQANPGKIGLEQTDLGQTGQTLPAGFHWKPLEEAGVGRSPRQRRGHALEINALVTGGRLRIAWTFGVKLHRRATVERLARSYRDYLAAIAAHCRAQTVPHLTPSDVPAARATQEQLDALMAAVASQASGEFEANGLEDVFELTASQQGMLYHSLLGQDLPRQNQPETGGENGAGVYHNQLTCRITGNLDEALFAEAWQRTLDRHAALRASFHWDATGNGKPLQAVHRRVALPFDADDLRDLTSERAAAAVAAYLKQDRRRGFDPSQAPLMRVRLHRMADAEWRVCWTHHHLLLDGWSAAIVLGDVMAFYKSLLDRQPATLPAPPRFRDYVQWLQSQSSGDLEQDAERYWRAELGSFHTPTPLAPHQETSPAPSNESSAQSLAEAEAVLGPEETASLTAFARQHGLTLNTLAQAGWAALLSRYSGEPDVVFGHVVSGRPPELPGADRMAGMLINVLPARVAIPAGRVDAGPDQASGIETWLRSLQTKTLERGRYSHCGLTQIQSWSGVAAGTPLFESLLIVENYPVTEALAETSCGVRFDEVRAWEPNNYPLTMVVSPSHMSGDGGNQESPDVGASTSNREIERSPGAAVNDLGLTLKVLYDTGRFGRASMARMLQHYRTLLMGLTGTPEAQTAASFSSSSLCKPRFSNPSFSSSFFSNLPPANLPMLTAAEIRQLEDWNATAAAAGAGETFLDLFAQSVRADPNRTALRCGAETRTYRELDLRSTELAARLAALAGPEDRVAVLMERGVELVESMLAIWKCGAAYVPIDPHYPPARIQLLLERSKPAAVILSSRPSGIRSGTLPGATVPGDDPPMLPAGVPVLTVPGTSDAESPALPRNAPAPHPAPNRAHPNGLAYVIFTSGSTGVPKGVMIEHRGLVNHLRSMVEDLGLGPGSRVAQTASQCFDISLWQLVGALTCSGEVVIYPGDIIADPAELARQLDRDGIEAAQFVPSYFGVLLDALESGFPHLQPGALQPNAPPAANSQAPETRPKFPHLRWLVLIGETLQPALVARWFRLYPEVRLMNAYGPTEASDSVTHFPMDAPPAGASIPIGRPIRNLRIHILDAAGNRCPVGIPGEIWIAGAGVARGYLFDPERTRAAFRAETGGGAGRMYRTGDLGCWSEDGTLRFFGRRDSQVKIRGHRIELGEIESALTALAQVRNAAVVTCQPQPHPDQQSSHPPGDLELVAYVAIEDEPPRPEGALRRHTVPQRDEGSQRDELRRALQVQLPEYMLPATVIFLDQLPLTPNGKVDRPALSKSAALARSRAAAPAAGNDALDRMAPSNPALLTQASAQLSDGNPRNPTEAALVRIWQELLGRAKVGVGEHFLEIGGHSLRAIQMAGRIRAALGAETGVRDIFEHPTIRELARHIEQTAAHGPHALPGPSPDAAPNSHPNSLPYAVPNSVPIPQAARRPWYPASHTQKRIWLASRTAEGSAAHNMASALRLTGDLNRTAATAALRALVERHESLRTTLTLREGELAQVIQPPDRCGFRVEETDCRPTAARPNEEGSGTEHGRQHGRELGRERGAQPGSPDEPSAASRFATLRREQEQAPFDLAKGPLFRATLARLGEREHAILLTVHHAVADAWSVRVLLWDLAALYGAFATGTPDPLEPLRLQFKDYAAWQARQIESGAMEPHRAYWRQRLAPPLNGFQFRSGWPRPTTSSGPATSIRPATPIRPATAFSPATASAPTADPEPDGRVAIAVDGDLYQRLSARARQSSTTPYATALAAIFCLLHLRSGSEDIVIGSQTAGREDGEWERQVGCYLNTVVLRQRLEPGMTVDRLILQTGRMLAEALEHQAYPFDLLLEDLRADRPAAQQPFSGQQLFNVQADYVPAAFARTLDQPQGVTVTDITDTAGEPNPETQEPVAAAKYDLAFLTTEEKVEDAQGKEPEEAPQNEARQEKDDVAQAVPLSPSPGNTAPRRRIRIVIEYRGSAFSRASAATIARDLERILGRFASAPGESTIAEACGESPSTSAPGQTAGQTAAQTAAQAAAQSATAHSQASAPRSRKPVRAALRLAGGSR